MVVETSSTDPGNTTARASLLSTTYRAAPGPATMWSAPTRSLKRWISAPSESTVSSYARRSTLSNASRCPAGPTSPPRMATGKIFPGFSRPSGSKTFFIFRIASRSSALNMSGMKSRFSRPIPCSPVRLPPISTQALTISAPISSALRSSPRSPSCRG